MGGAKTLRLLTRDELPVDTVEQARFLIGKLVVRTIGRERMVGRIVETEAYVPGDAACHAFRGMTPRNRSLFLVRGHAYVHLAYGVSWMLNVVGGEPGIGTGVLVRALEPVQGLAGMKKRRGTTRLVDLARGPGRLAQALGIDKRLDGIDLLREGPLHLAADGASAGEIGVSTRIGLTKEADRPLRFFLKSSPYVSGSRKLNGG